MNQIKRRGVTIRLAVPRKSGRHSPVARFFGIARRLLIVFARRFKSTIVWRNRHLRSGTLFIASALLVAQIAAVLDPFLVQKTYALGAAESLLMEREPLMAKNLTYNAQQQMFSFDSKQSLEAGAATSAGGGVTATAYADASKGVSVSDSTNKVNFTLTPKFPTAAGQKDGNRIVYPLTNHDGWAVYTMTAVGAKEDIVLKSANADTALFEYEIKLGDNLEARKETDGSIGIYGNALLSGNITTGTEKDAALLQKARQNAPKNTRLFVIPAPTIKETGKGASSISAHYELDGTSLKVAVSGLKKGSYPLTIDPSIYVVTASQFMYGNNESNINFDVTNKLIKKGRTTGARFDSWQSTTTLPTGQFSGGAVASGGFLYQVGGSSATGGSTIVSTQGSVSYKVPMDASSITVKMWGGGGGSAGSYAGYPGGAGGGGGYVASTLSVTPGETLTLYVGGGGGPGTTCSGFFCGGGLTGGGGGGYSSIFRGGTPLLIAAGGGGGGGAMNTIGGGGAGGAGGGTTGVSGSPNVAGQTNGGGGGTQSAGGAGGVGNCNGAAGSSLTGGGGGQYVGGCNTGGNANGGGGGGGAGGTGFTGAGNGGGGGGGYYGGGGGAQGNSTGNTAGGGGGGGSSYTTGSSVTNSAGSGTSPGNSSDTDRGTAGQGGASVNANSDGTAGTNGLIIISTPSSGNLAGASVNWAQFDTGNGTVVNANPGSGTCSGWCSSPSYNLPANRANFSLVAYNGYLYAMGGNDESGPGVSNHKFKTVYVAKLGANGEPRLWHPTDTNKANWVYWYHDDTNMTLPSERIQGAAVAYNNKMYFIGGLDNSSAVGAANSTVWVADILPNGKLGSWSTSTALTSGGPGATFGATALIYNDYLYLIGGAGSVGGTPFTSNTYYIKINSDGTLASSWAHTNDFTTGRTTGGGANAVIWGGYIYLTGGCSVTDSGSNYCTTTLSDTQIASINADGSLGTWSTVSGVTKQAMGVNLLAWRDTLYSLGGCSQQSATTGVCSGGAQNGISYGTIKQDGDVSTITTSAASGAAPCTGTTPANCNLPATGSVGYYLNTTVVSNGYLYVIGGCTNTACSATSGGVAFTQVSATGDLVQPASCPSGSSATGGWCVFSATISGGMSAAAPVVYNDAIYLVGGSSGAALKNTIYRATVTPSTGALSAWSADTMTSIGATSVKYTYAAVRANPAGAGSNPAYMYIIGGCTTASGPGCTTYTQNVYRCNITASGAVGGCSTSGQLQLGTVTGASGVGLGYAGGAIYGNYIYLVGGSAPGVTELATTRYAKFNSSNNIVTVGSGWVESSQTLSTAVRGSSVFAYNGYLYVVGGINATSGIKNNISYVKINTDTGNLDSSGWRQSVVTITGRWGLAIAVSNSYAYIIGGCTTGTTLTNCSAATTAVERFNIYNNNSGAPAGWSTAANSYTTARYYQGSTVWNGYIYVAGGCTTFSANDCSGAASDVQRAQIDSTTGAIGTWSATTASLPKGLGGGKLFNVGGTLYFVGGVTAGYSTNESTVYYATPASNGNITSWSTASNNLPQGRSFFGGAVWNNRMYIVGGRSGSCTNSVCNTVYISPQLNSGGNITSAWTSSANTFSVSRMNLAAVAYANNLYLLGGINAVGGTYLSDTQYAKIDTSTGDIGSWTFSTSLPAGLTLPDAFAANGYIYVMGGYRNGAACSASTMVAPISANTTIASGNNPTGIGNWFETNTFFSGARYGAASIYNNGKAYLLGGFCPNAAVSPNVQQTTLFTQPQIAKYSIAFDTDTDVYPTRYLVNGIDNSIGSSWQLKYQTMSDPSVRVPGLGTDPNGDPGIECSATQMSNWGQTTTISSLALGSLGTYSPLDSSGTNMSCGRYYFLNLSIDAQASFGYPDDTSRGPTITDISLRYTAAPSQRSMHGRTFINGIQTPLDTPKYDY